MISRDLEARWRHEEDDRRSRNGLCFVCGGKRDHVPGGTKCGKVDRPKCRECHATIRDDKWNGGPLEGYICAACKELNATRERVC